MTSNKSPGLPPLFLLAMTDQGYAAAKHLSTYGIPIVGFFPNNKGFEYFSRLPCQKHVLPASNNDRMALLRKTAGDFDQKPVLMLTAESYFPFIYEHFDEINQLFALEMPDADTLHQMLDKNRFSAFAETYHLKTPKSTEVGLHLLPEEQLSEDLNYPLVIKPKYRTDRWNGRYHTKKAFLAHNRQEALSVCTELLQVIDWLVVQEFVPGPDTNVYFCLTYLTASGEALDTFCGQKIHQHPILFGNTSSALAADLPALKAESLRILKTAQMSGFCSVEFKQHAVTGDFYVIEPTVGRMDRQQYVAMVSKHDMVLKAYCHLARIPQLTPRKQKENFLYVEESLQMKSYLDYHHYKSKEQGRIRHLLRTHKIRFMHLTLRDPLPSLLVLAGVLKHLLHYLLKGKTRYFEEDDLTRQLLQLNHHKAQQSGAAAAEKKEKVLTVTK